MHLVLGLVLGPPPLKMLNCCCCCYSLLLSLTLGEDTMGQLERRFGRQQAAQRILGLNAIWISHIHADHHGGLYPLLMRRQQLQQQKAAGTQQQQQQQQQPLLIMGPWPLFRVLSNYSDVLGLQFRFLPNTYFSAARSPHEPPVAVLAAYQAAREACELSVLEPFPVQHVAHSTGLRLESKDGWKVVFSGRARQGITPQVAVGLPRTRTGCDY
jgi:ribonuclease Z